MKSRIPALIISGLSGGSGKNLVTLGIMAVLKRRGYIVAPFKKGPDFIDPAWLSIAAGAPCRNLDVFLMGEKQVKASFTAHSAGADVCVIEGNRGLFDGFDKKGSYSTANLAKLIGAKVILIIDCTKMTGTAAALVKGCQKLDPKLKIAGIILNRVGGRRHEKVIRDAIRYHTGLPVVGAIPKLNKMSMFERHLGLLPPWEHKQVRQVIQGACKVAEQYIEISKIIKNIQKKKNKFCHAERSRSMTDAKHKRVGIVLDQAFNFYYPENLEALQACGAELVFLNALRDKQVPELDLLYIGGGFPETHGRMLERNISFRRSLKQAVENGLRVYAECGGVVFLGKRLKVKGKSYAMSGVFPVNFDFSEKPQGHGYTVLKIDRKNPFFKIGTVLKGHEFHYTGPAGLKGARFAAKVQRGFGFNGKRDGLVYKNVLAMYTHLHAYGLKNWAKSLLLL
jgi:cobyrinic acid a,c-diamide synthase